MTLLTPLGLLALLSIIALIIIYIIRPNYQQKFVSSTFAWKLALKRKRKRIPVSKLRNILLIVCQILILLSLTALLTTPSKPLEVKVDAVEVVAIVDASASMRTKDEGNVSRYERALEQVDELAQEAFNNGGFVSLMLAGEKNRFLVEKITAEDSQRLTDAIDEALGYDDDECGFGTSDLDSAILMCQEVIEANPSTQVHVFSDIEYGYIPNNIVYTKIADEAESNLAILNAYAELNDNYYNFHIDVASYGKDVEMTLNFTINGANESDSEVQGRSITLRDIKATCTDSVVKSLVLCSESLYSEENKELAEEKGVLYYNIRDLYTGTSSQITNFYSFSSINIQIVVDANTVDSYTYDNTFNIYGGQKESIKVQFATTDENCVFLNNGLDTVARHLSQYWNISIDEKHVKQNDRDDTTYATEGYDVYVFEHKMPTMLPTDGLVVLIDPIVGSQPYGSGFRVISQDTNKKKRYLTVENNHNIIGNVNVSDVSTTKLTIVGFEPNYNFDVIASVDGQPVIAVREEKGAQLLLMAMDIHYSNFAVSSDFIIFWLNVFNHFLPPTVRSHSYEVYESLSVNARSDELKITDLGTEGKMYNETVNIFPSQVAFDIPGTYQLSQLTYTNKSVDEYIYVRTPMSESNIFEKKDSLLAPYKPEIIENKYKDLMLYLAIALVVLIFAEWWLQARDNM